MNGVHDLGGMDGLGPVVREANEPAFHDEWERKVMPSSSPPSPPVASTSMSSATPSST